jgi:hypothetical protein
MEAVGDCDCPTRILQRVQLFHLVRRFVLLMNTAASHAQRLEGSRFVRRQLYRMAAGGSRKRPRIHLVADVGALSGNDPCQTLD